MELSGAPETKDETIIRAKELFEAADMEVITINKEIKGFVLNRLQVALLNEAFKLVEDGIVSGADLDKTIKHGLGLRWSIMGPMETIDLNAPGGIRDYLERFGPAFEAIAKEQSSIRPWDTSRFITMEEERRKVMPIREIAPPCPARKYHSGENHGGIRFYARRRFTDRERRSGSAERRSSPTRRRFTDRE